jgi:glyoxylase-like metal-dependent hydrolase (beta-lactamase superfamily II)
LLNSPKGDHDLDWLPGIRLRFVYGHTEAMMLPIISTPKGTLVYCADLMPSSHHLGMPYVMAYDVRPLEVLKEKQKILTEVVENQWTLMFEHDPKTECGSVTADESGRFRFGEGFRLAERF